MPPPSCAVALKQQPTTKVRASGLIAFGEAEWGWNTSKDPPRELPLLLSHLSNGSPFARVFLIWCDLAFSQGNEKAFIKNKQWWWFSITAPRDDEQWGKQQPDQKPTKQTKNPKGKVGEWYSIGSFEKLCYIPVNLEGHIHRLMHIRKAVRRSEKTLSFWLWAEAELSNSWVSSHAPKCTQSSSKMPRRFVDSRKTIAFHLIR